MDDAEQGCVICMEEFTFDSVISKPKTCGIHCFHHDCLLKWVKT